MPVRWSWKPRRIGSEVCAWTKPGTPARAPVAPVAARPLSTPRRLVVVMVVAPLLALRRLRPSMWRRERKVYGLLADAG